MSNKKKNKYWLLLILLLGITLGYAAISTTLKITGIANVNKNTWSVYWDENSIEVTQGSVAGTAGVSDDGTVEDAQLTWTADLDLPGDFYEFTIDAVNAGTIDAMISNITPTIPADLASYINYSVTYADGIDPGQYHLLAKGTKSGNTITPTREKYKVRVEFDSNVTTDDLDDIEENGDSYTFGYTIAYAQATDAAINRPVWILPQGKTSSTLAVGDEICFSKDTTQCFNFIRYDENDDVVMLAKYNLKVGEIINSAGNVVSEYTSSDDGYNLQSSDVRGYTTDEALKVGMVRFSKTVYWNKSGTFLDVYDSVNYAGAPGTDNYSIAYYVEAYKKILEDAGVAIKSARLLTENEVVDPSIGCRPERWSCPTNSFICNTSFFISASYSDKMSWVGSSYGRYFYDYSPNGVRPVIVIEKSDL